MEFQKDQDKYVIRLARGEQLLSSLTAFVEAEKVQGGFLVGLGAVDQIELAHYSVEHHKYSSKKFEQALEITNVTGSIAYYQNTPVVHCHGTFSDPDMNTFGGHIVEARISGTMEILLTVTDQIEKKEDPETGLKVMDLSAV